jgi:DNA adenine methylase
MSDQTTTEYAQLGPMKPLVPYHGSKGKLAGWIAGLMPPHRVYIEPFAGSLAVLLAKRPATHEVVNDIDGDVVNFYRMLRERPEDLEQACRLTPYARDEFYAADIHQVGIDDLERARRWWIRVTQGFGAITRAGNGWALSTKQGGSDPGGVANRLDRFGAVVQRLSRVAVENRDACEVIEAHATAETVVYADPPYLGGTREMHSTKAYAHEMTSEDDHRRLAATLHETPATVLLSGYPSPLYDELYGDWHCIERRVTKWSSNGRATVRPKVTEVIWANRDLGESDDQHALSGLVVPPEQGAGR